MDAIQEFQVNANSYPAEVGRASGGVINVITRSGTNDFHGTAFEFYRDKGMNAHTFVNNRVGAPKNPYHFNQFGGTLGGPVVRNKLFFFVSYDGQRNAQTQLVTPVTLPPPSAASVFNKYLTPYQIGLNNNVGLVKVDWNASDKDRVSVRYNISRYTGVNQESFGTNVAEEHSGNNEVNTDNIAANYQRVIGASMVYDGRLNYVADKQPGYANTTGPEVSITNGILFGANNFSPRYTNTKGYQPTSSLSWVSGRHSMKAGFDFNFIRAENYFPGFFAGGYTYASYDAFLAGTPLSFRQAFPGTGTSFPISHPDVNEYAHVLPGRMAGHRSSDSQPWYPLRLLRLPAARHAEPEPAASCGRISARSNSGPTRPTSRRVSDSRIGSPRATVWSFVADTGFTTPNAWAVAEHRDPE